MTRGDVAGRSDTQEAKASSTRMGFVHPLMQLRQGIANVGKAVQFAAKSEGEIFLGEFAELRENVIHAWHTDGVQAIGRRGYRSEADFVETKIVFQVAVNLEHVHGLRSHGHTRRDRPGAMASK